VWNMNAAVDHFLWAIHNAHDDTIYAVEYVQGTGEFATAGADHLVCVWNFHSRKLVRILVHNDEVTQVKWSPFLSLWVTCSVDLLLTWNREGERFRSFRAPAEITAMCMDHFTGSFVMGLSDKSISVYDFPQDKILQVNNGHTDLICSVVHLYQKNQYISVSWDKTVRIWNDFTKTVEQKLLQKEQENLKPKNYEQEEPTFTELHPLAPPKTTSFLEYVVNRTDTFDNPVTNGIQSPIDHLPSTGSSLVVPSSSASTSSTSVAPRPKKFKEKNKLTRELEFELQLQELRNSFY